MTVKILVLLTIFNVLSVNSQIPGFGRCPEYDAMPDFDKEKFMGTWYEVERYFSVTDVVSKCISADYERKADGQIYVKNFYKNRM
jgi:apolipoprotein D and lipocalin family protein